MPRAPCTARIRPSALRNLLKRLYLSRRPYSRYRYPNGYRWPYAFVEQVRLQKYLTVRYRYDVRRNICAYVSLLRLNYGQRCKRFRSHSPLSFAQPSPTGGSADRIRRRDTPRARRGVSAKAKLGGYCSRVLRKDRRDTITRPFRFCIKYSPIAQPEYGAMYKFAAFSAAEAATIIVYFIGALLFKKLYGSGDV